MSVLLFMEDGKSPLESLIMTSDSKFDFRNGALCTSKACLDESNQRKYSSDNDVSVETRNSESSSENELSDYSRRRASAPPIQSSSTTMLSSVESSIRSKNNINPITDSRDDRRRVYSKNERRAIQMSEQKSFSQQAATSIVHHGFYV